MITEVKQRQLGVSLILHLFDQVRVAFLCSRDIHEDTMRLGINHSNLSEVQPVQSQVVSLDVTTVQNTKQLVGLK